MSAQRGGKDPDDEWLSQRREDIREAFDAPGLGTQLSRLQEDAHERVARQGCLRVLTWDPDDPKADELWPVRGSVALFFADRGNETILELETAYATSDLKTLSRLGKQLQEANLQREPTSVEYAVDELVEASCYVDLSYDGKLLAPFVAPVGDVEVGNLNFAYSGGELDPEKLRYVERLRPDTTEGLEAFLVVRPPKLSDIEREVLRKVPPGHSQIHIGSAASCPAATVVVVLVITAVTAAGKACADFRDRLGEVTITPSDLDRLGAIGTASEMLAQRRAVFADFGI